MVSYELLANGLVLQGFVLEHVAHPLQMVFEDLFELANALFPDTFHVLDAVDAHH